MSDTESAQVCSLTLIQDFVETRTFQGVLSEHHVVFSITSSLTDSFLLALIVFSIRLELTAKNVFFVCLLTYSLARESHNLYLLLILLIQDQY